MSQAVAANSAQTLTFQEYLFYQGEPDVLCELFRGRLIPMATPTALHASICQFLVYQFQQYIATHNNLDLVAMTTAGVRTEEASSRIPNIVVCSQSLWQQVRARPGAGVLDFNEVPVLVVEVTSENWREDYIRKRAEYAFIEIPEYWTIDPNKKQAWVLSNPDSLNIYEQQEFRPEQIIQSPQLTELALAVNQVLSPPLVEDLIRQEQVERQQLEPQVSEERQRADGERQRTERLAARLREMGVDPNAIEGGSWI